jgi:hypothetical protein
MHSLTAATNIFAPIIAGLAKLPLAKILDLWGRPQGLTLMLVIWALGFIMMASCNGVETFAAAQVFSLVGYVTRFEPQAGLDEPGYVFPEW